MRKACLLTVAAILAVGQPGAAQTFSNARAVGLAGAYTALARGVWAPKWNPANLGLRGNPRFGLNLVGAGMLLGNSSFSKSTYDQYNGKYLSPEDIQNLIDAVPEGDGLHIYVDTDIQALAFSLGRIALSVDMVAASDVKIARDYLRIALEGIGFDQSYNIGDNAGEAIAYSSVKLSMAFPLPLPGRTRLGLNLKYLIGLGVAQIVESYGEFYNGWESYGEGRVRARYAQGGAGFAYDLGLAAQAGRWYLSAAWLNLGARIRWSVEPQEYEVSFHTVKPFTVENSADEDSLIASEEYSRNIDAFTTAIPGVMRLGIARTWGAFVFSVDYHQGFSQRAGVSTRPYFALGCEWNGLRVLPLRVGVGFGGRHGSLLAMGFGIRLGFFHLDYGVSFPGALTPAKAKAVSMALATYLHF